MTDPILVAYLAGVGTLPAALAAVGLVASVVATIVEKVKDGRPAVTVSTQCPHCGGHMVSGYKRVSRRMLREHIAREHHPTDPGHADV